MELHPLPDEVEMSFLSSSHFATVPAHMLMMQKVEPLQSEVVKYSYEK